MNPYWRNYGSVELDKHGCPVIRWFCTGVMCEVPGMVDEVLAFGPKLEG